MCVLMDNVTFVNEFNFRRWLKDKKFYWENANDAILETIIDYLAPEDGRWFLIIENEGRKTATVKVLLWKE